MHDVEIQIILNIIGNDNIHFKIYRFETTSGNHRNFSAQQKVAFKPGSRRSDQSENNCTHHSPLII